MAEIYQLPDNNGNNNGNANIPLSIPIGFGTYGNGGMFGNGNGFNSIADLFGLAIIASILEHYMIFVRYAKEHGDIAHEVFHACNCILKSRGFELTDMGESYAYLIGFVTNKVYEILDNKG